MTRSELTDVSWAGFVKAEPDFADRVRRRFERYTHHVLATLRKDGSPRLTGLEADFREGELWLGMMPSSLKALDLRRDPRFSLYANPGSGTEMDGGDARVTGRAVEVRDEEETARWAAGAPEGHAPEVFHLFRVELTEVVVVFIEAPDIVFRTWKPGRPLRTIRRGNDDAPPRED
ncbi:MULTISPECIES: pyridoxamine 5'-phosphate oxidase family protein [unclassified Streptomyces]|uniref:pyridoxamine 5'-phosphate oxidase family protein n=1 Tax=unclassified Streptomyces TaxID=2593676 RepID=UPI002DDB8657|nr:MULTISPECIES: pyridoxamine 5'-phosphate oxidase family protein [unclassified Streptomyces]WSB75865.1 pyridoxamine 5'-phosphate oxidase family protein [Streptomyces sp. NBC_01775]WSS15860.1 pyridoxamine 5'-phosphate oxidase family protein [Streptomyces sp. NBC_01186]WSS44699.1 pyridoxamine 5'-phosphate oxidase family protein [Streptomyces sp. NBC_01187]